MKKFFSFVCVALLALSAGATGFAPAKLAPKRALKSVRIEKKMSATLEAAKPQASVKKAPAAVQQSVNITLAGETTEDVFSYYTSGDWYFYDSDINDEYVVVLDYYNYDPSSMCGSFTAADLDADYSGIMDYVNFTSVEIADGSNFIVSENDGVITVEGNLIGSDNVTYIINGSYTLVRREPEAIQDTITLNIPAGELVDYTAEMGAWQMAGYSADETTYASIAVFATSVVGSYPDVAGSIVGLEDYNIIYTDIDDYGEQENYIYDGNFTVRQNGDVYTLEGGIHAGTHWVILTITATEEEYEDPDDPDDPEENEESAYDMQQDVVATFTTADITDQGTETTDYGYSYTYYALQNANNEVFAILFYHYDATLPAGTYAFGGASLPQAQTGELDLTEGSVYPSYYGTLSSDAYLNVPLFLCKDGSVQISFDDNGKPLMQVSATNNWNKTLTVTVGPSTALNDVDADASALKRIENGQLIIIRDGERYNALGQSIE